MAPVTRGVTEVSITKRPKIHVPWIFKANSQRAEWQTSSPSLSKCFSALSFSLLTLHGREFLYLTNIFLALFESLPQRLSTPPSTDACSPRLEPFGLKAVVSSLPAASPHPVDLSLHLAS